MKWRPLHWLTLIVIGCHSNNSGTFQIEFDWLASKRPQTEALYAYTEVRAPDLHGHVETLASAGPELLQTPVALQLGSVPKGQARSIYVELRAVRSLDAPVLFYGISKVFDLTHNGPQQVAVRIPITQVPHNNHLYIVKQHTDGVIDSTSTRQVDLLLDSNTGVRVKLANRLDALDNATPQPMKARMSWELQGDCKAECKREVFARFVDAHGYASPVVSQVITLDVQAPQIIDNSIVISPQVARGNSVVKVEFATNEVVVDDAEVWLEHDGQTQRAPFNIVSTGSLLTLVALQPAHEMFLQEGAYALVLRGLQDTLGNTAPEVMLGNINYDVTAPAIYAFVLSTRHVSDLPGFNTLRVDFSTDADSYELTIGDHDVSPCRASQSGQQCEYVVQDGDTEGLHPVILAARDHAGNLSTRQSFVDFDFSPPTLDWHTASVSLLPDANNLLRTVSQVTFGTRVILQVTPSEPVTALTAALLNGNAATPFVQLSSMVFALDPNISQPPQGPYQVQYVLTDRVGNTSVVRHAIC
jgi:hypothetical protein